MNETTVTHDEEFVRSFDRRDWDAGTERTLFGHQYRQRVDAICDAVKSNAPGRRVVDLGAAQGNIAVRLAGEGLEVTAVERNPAFIAYARTKPDADRVRWVRGDLRDLDLGAEQDAAILGEVIEHTGTPDRLLGTIAGLLRPGGVLVLTTPNGERIREHLPSFEAWRSAHHPVPEWVQFGPAGEDHEFLYTRSELRSVLSSRFELVAMQPVASAVWNRGTERWLGTRAGTALGDAFESAMLRLPVASARLANHWLAVARRR